MKKTLKLAPLVAAAIAIAGCPTTTTNNNTPGGCSMNSDCDAGFFCDPAGFCAPNGGPPDVGTIDSGPFDAGTDAGPHDAGPDAGPIDGGPDAGLSAFCQLPGSWIHDSSGMHVNGTDPAVAANATKTYPGTWLTIPEGFCAHHFGTVGNARQMRFAPNGDLFVASPTGGTTGGGGGGKAAIVVLPDDDHDGVADSVMTFKSSMTNSQGIMFANGSIYFQADQDAASAMTAGGCASGKGTAIWKEAYTMGQRADNGQATQVADITYNCDGLHWPKTMDIDDNGTIYVGNGGSQNDVCEETDGGSGSMPYIGGIVQLDSTGGVAGCSGCTPIINGLRNPIDIKCHHGFGVCYATELAKDYSYAPDFGREKFLPINAGDNWGFPCCATRSQAYSGVSVPGFSSVGCSTVASDTNSFFIGDTPFGFDFEDTQFPSPWDHQAIIALHGAAGGWKGARVVAVALDTTTGGPLASSTVTNDANSGNMQDFATGWDDSTTSGHLMHGRPSDVTLAPDGRLFIANDNSGEIFWVASTTSH